MLFSVFSESFIYCVSIFYLLPYISLTQGRESVLSLLLPSLGQKQALLLLPPLIHKQTPRLPPLLAYKQFLCLFAVFLSQFCILLLA